MIFEDMSLKNDIKNTGPQQQKKNSSKQVAKTITKTTTNIDMSGIIPFSMSTYSLGKETIGLIDRHQPITSTAKRARAL